jgi:hypothetical protein
MNLFDRLAESKKLPLGHYERNEASKAVSEVYLLCRENESKFCKLLRKKFKTGWLSSKKPEVWKKLCDKICDVYGIVRIKTFVLSSPDCHACSGGHYSRREIHVPHNYCELRVCLHELAHHFQIMDDKRGGHGQDFIEYENLVFDGFWKVIDEDLIKELK